MNILSNEFLIFISSRIKTSHDPGMHNISLLIKLYRKYSIRMLHEQKCLISQMNKAFKEFDKEVVKLRTAKIELNGEVRSRRP